MQSGQTGDEAAVDVSGGSRRGREMPLEVQHIRDALRREFTSRISMADYEGRAGTDLDNAFLSRSLAARAARILTDCSSDEAAAGVIDGRDDFGIDAVAFSASGSELWLIQAKWSDRGQAGFNTAAAHKLIHGLKKLDNRDFDQFNVRLQSLADRVRGVLGLPTCKVFLIVAVVGEGETLRGDRGDPKGSSNRFRRLGTHSRTPGTKPSGFSSCGSRRSSSRANNDRCHDVGRLAFARDPLSSI